MAQPHHPHRLQNLALGVESGVPYTAGAQPARLVKALYLVRPGGRFAGRAPGMIGEIFQFGIPASGQSPIAQRFVVAGAISDGQLAVFPKLLLAFKVAGFLNDCAKDVCRHRTNSGDALKLAHFPKDSSKLLHAFERLLPLCHGMIKLAVEPPHHSSLFLGR